MTATLLGTGRQVAVFVAVDHCSAGCVGIHAATRGTRFEALQPIRQGVRECFGTIGKGMAAGLTIRHDNGSQYISHDFRNEIAWLGVKSSPSFVRAPEGNSCAERFIRTLKENLLWVRTFGTIEEMQQALQAFKDDYNEQWLIQRHRHRSSSGATQWTKYQPSHRLHECLNNPRAQQQRKVVYSEAKKRHPERWSGKIRNWTIAPIVWLNPDTEERQAFEEDAA